MVSEKKKSNQIHTSQSLIVSQTKLNFSHCFLIKYVILQFLSIFPFKSKMKENFIVTQVSKNVIRFQCLSQVFDILGQNYCVLQCVVVQSHIDIQEFMQNLTCKFKWVSE